MSTHESVAPEWCIQHLCKSVVVFGQLGEASSDFSIHCAERMLVGYPNIAAEIREGRHLVGEQHPPDIVAEPMQSALFLRHLRCRVVAFGERFIQAEMRLDDARHPTCIGGPYRAHAGGALRQVLQVSNRIVELADLLGDRNLASLYG